MLNIQLAHHIRNRASQIFVAACSIRSYCRWCLTGTPIHNSLDDYGALLTFLRVPGLTERNMFEFWIAKPIKEKKLEGFTRLQTLVRSTCLRRTKESIGDVLRLPNRQEKIEYVPLNQQDQIVYDFFKARSANLASRNGTSNTAVPQLDDTLSGGIICLLNFLRLICNHGEQLLPETALRMWNTRDQSMATLGEIRISDESHSPRYSAKVMALLRNLVESHTPRNNLEGNYIPVKRYESE
jgi:SNF2 family DNA or RNA helicase